MGDWELRRRPPDGWLLMNTSDRPAKAVEVEFTGRVDGRPWREGVTVRPAVLGAGAETYIRIFRSDTVTGVVVTWRGRFGRRRTWHADIAADATAAPTGSGFDMRVAVLPVDRGTVLPLAYTYDRGSSTYQSLGYVRLGQLMLPSVSHRGPDTAAGRDAFLVAALVGLTIPEGRARRIVRSAEHQP